MNKSVWLIVMSLIVFFSIVIFLGVTASELFYDDYDCGTDTCIYYNKTMYYEWCDYYYGQNNWYLQNINAFEAMYGVGGMYLAKSPFDTFYEYSVCFKK